MNNILIEGTLNPLLLELKYKNAKISYHHDDQGETMIRISPELGFEADKDIELFEKLKELFLIRKPKTTYMCFYYIQFYPNIVGFEKYNENG